MEMFLDAGTKLNFEMHLEAVIEPLRRCIGRPRLYTLEMHLEAVIEKVWRCTWML